MSQWAKFGFLEQGNQRIEYIGEIVSKSQFQATIECPAIGTISAPIESSGASTFEVLEDSLSLAEITEFNVRNSGKNKDEKSQTGVQRGSRNPSPRKTQEVTQEEKTYTVAGTSFYRGKYQLRVANDKNRSRVLEKNGHEEVKMVDLPRPMTREEAKAYLLESITLTDSERSALN